jgi:CcmD family protein
MPEQEMITTNPIPYLIGGFGSFWLLILGYLYSLRRRRAALDRELTLLEDDR